MCGACCGDLDTHEPARHDLQPSLGLVSPGATSPRAVTSIGRRRLLRTIASASIVGIAGCAQRGRQSAIALPSVTPAQSSALTVADGLDIVPRDTWGTDLPPTGPLSTEDVRFLLIHHTASSNVIPDQRSLIRSVYAFHTGPRKRWADVAYNFFVGPDGTVWEGRAGSIDGPVIADATGGNQGYSQLVCLLGDFSSRPPTDLAQTSLVRLLAHLASRHGLSTWKNATATFTSRGSNKLPAGTAVSTSTISGHRDMTYTSCPGDGAYTLLDEWRQRVHPIVAAGWQRTGLQPAERNALEAP